MGIAFIEPRADDSRLIQTRRYRMVVDGQSVDALSGETIKRRSPAWPDIVVGEWPKVEKADVERAIAAARRAFDEGPWPRMSTAERSRIMTRVAELVAAEPALSNARDAAGVSERGISPIGRARSFMAGGDVLTLIKEGRIPAGQASTPSPHSECARWRRSSHTRN